MLQVKKYALYRRRRHIWWLDSTALMFLYCSMTKNAWSRWGRGDCMGYSLSIGDGGFTRFEGSVTRGVRGDGGGYSWSSSINGMCQQTHATLEEAMGRVEFELSITGEAFVASFAGYKAHRHENNFSQAVDAMRRAHGSNFLKSNGAA